MASKLMKTHLNLECGIAELFVDFKVRFFYERKIFIRSLCTENVTQGHILEAE